MPTITPFLWFAGQAEEAAAFYVSVFPNSAIRQVSRYGEAGREQHGQTPGTAMTVAFELDGQPFTALNGGPVFQFSPAVSFVVHCKTQAEVDHYWEKLGAGGAPEAQQCGWLADRLACRGRSCRTVWSTCCPDQTPPLPDASWKRCCK